MITSDEGVQVLRSWGGTAFVRTGIPRSSLFLVIEVALFCRAIHHWHPRIWYSRRWCEDMWREEHAGRRCLRRGPVPVRVLDRRTWHPLETVLADAGNSDGIRYEDAAWKEVGKGRRK